MPYDIKDKLARRGFWFIFPTNEGSAPRERYTFNAEVTLEGEDKPLLTLDSTKHTFWYKTLTEKNDAEYKKVPAGGIGVDDLPCIIAFHVELPPDSEVTAKARATDWKDAVISETNKLNVQDFDDVTEIRLDMTAAYRRRGDEEPPPTHDIPILPPVPIVLLEARGRVTPDPNGFCTDALVMVYDWTGHEPSVVVNGKRPPKKPQYVNQQDVEATGADEYTGLPPVPLAWKGNLKALRSQPRLEIVATNGQYCGASHLKYLAKAKDNAVVAYEATNGRVLKSSLDQSGTKNAEVLTTAFADRSYHTPPRAKDHVLGESLPFAPTPDEVNTYYGIKVRLTGEPLVTVGESASPEFWESTGSQLSFGEDSGDGARLACKGAGIPTDATMLVKDSSTGRWKEQRVSYEALKYHTRPLLCVEKGHSKRKRYATPGVVFSDIGSVLTVTIRSSTGYNGKGAKKRRMLAHVLGLTAVGQCAGFVDESVGKAVTDRETATGAEPSLRMHRWDSQVLLLSPSRGHCPSVKAQDGHASHLFRSRKGGMLKFILKNRAYDAERSYLRRYGCEEFHPVRLWLHAKQPVAKNCTEPMWSLSRACIIEEFRSRLGATHHSDIAFALRGNGLLAATAWNLLYRVYLSGHLNGLRLGHPAPDDAILLFDGWPGLAPAFLFSGAQVEVPPGNPIIKVADHANLTAGQNVFGIALRQGRAAALQEWGRQVGRYSSGVNADIKGRIAAPEFEVYPLNPANKPEHLGEYLVAPIVALGWVAKYLYDHPECESVSLGGYSIGTNRALWLADALEGRFQVYIPKSNTLEKHIRETQPGEKELLGVSYTPWAMNNYDLFDVLKRRVCVNHAAFMDFNFGAATFLPFTTKYIIPTNVRQVHHVFSKGRRMTAGINHYGYRRPRGPQVVWNWEPPLARLQSQLWGGTPGRRLNEMLDARARRFCCHRARRPSLGQRLPSTVPDPAHILEHTANLWETYENLTGVTGGKVHPKALAELDLGALKAVFEEHLPRALDALDEITIDGEPLTYPHGDEMDELIKQVKARDIAIEDLASKAAPVLMRFALWLLFDVFRMLLDRLARAIENLIRRLLIESLVPGAKEVFEIADAIEDVVEAAKEIKEFVDAVLAALKIAFEKLYWSADTQMMLAYSEDGVANSSGGGFIFKTDGDTRGDGLLHPGGTYLPVAMDHLQMGRNAGGIVSRFVADALCGKYGRIR
jgi:hypothetical protein